MAFRPIITIRIAFLVHLHTAALSCQTAAPTKQPTKQSSASDQIKQPAVTTFSFYYNVVVFKTKMMFFEATVLLVRAFIAIY